MANPIGMIAGKIASEVAEGLAKKAAPVVASAAKKATKVVDDWGWKGGKKGELTGTEFKSKKFGSPEYESGKAQGIKQLSATSAKKPGSPIATNYANMLKQVSADEAAVNSLNDFAKLEEAGIPREYTGRVLNAMYKRAQGKTRMPINLARVTYMEKGNFTPDKISKKLALLTAEQRDTLLSLLPEWEGSLDDLANAAKNL